MPDTFAPALAERYLMPAGVAETEIVIKNSIFIGTVGPASTPEAARELIARVRADYPDANHHAWAFYIEGGPQAQIGSSDDGEPGGTAGRPMLAVLEGSGLVKVAAVGTRYWGGIKLGTGGLVRAYSQCVREALKTLPTQEMLLHQVARIAVDYALYSTVKYQLPRYGVHLDDEQFAAQVELTMATPVDRMAAWGALLRELTNGAVDLRASVVGQRYDAPAAREAWGAR
jgi:uncharacterized YigZ family protein